MRQAGHLCRSTSVQLACRIHAAWSTLLAISDSIDQCILIAGKSPCCQNTIAQWYWFPYPPWICGWGNRTDFFVQPAGWIKKNESSLACITHMKCRSANSHCLQWNSVDGSSEAVFDLLCVVFSQMQQVLIRCIWIGGNAVQAKPFLVKHSILHANRCISAVLSSNKKSTCLCEYLVLKRLNMM